MQKVMILEDCNALKAVLENAAFRIYVTTVNTLSEVTQDNLFIKSTNCKKRLLME